MANFDGTGPGGNGPMTGRARGKCILPLTTRDQEMKFLKNRSKALQTQLNHIKLGKNASGSENEREVQTQILQQQLKDIRARIQQIGGNQERRKEHP